LYGVAKTRWALFLEELGMSEDDALCWLHTEEASGIKRRIRLWVRMHHQHCFVPEEALRRCGVKLEEATTFVAAGVDGRHWARAKGPHGQYGASREAAVC
jgi:hypothetical protein